MVVHSKISLMCCNPAHLWLGTYQDNSDDMVSKDRQASGERNKQSKLIDEQVIEIRKLSKEGILNKNLAEKYGVNTETISELP